MPWQVKAGHDNVATLANMVQQPAMPRGIEYPELRFAANGTAARHGIAFCDLEWNVIKRIPLTGSTSVRDQLLAQFGLSDSTTSAAVTVQLRNNSGTYANYNATAILLDQGQRAAGRWERLVIRLARLVVIPDEE